MSTPFSSDYWPSFPTLPVTFGVVGETPRIGPYGALLDTGADMTLVPAEILESMQAQRLDDAELVTQWGEIHPVILYLVEVQVGPARLPGVFVAGDDSTTEIILGRNVLNKLPLFLDGPKEMTDVLDDAAAHRLRTRRESTEEKRSA